MIQYLHMEHTHAGQAVLPTPIGAMKETFSLYKKHLRIILLIGATPAVISVIRYFLDVQAHPLISTLFGIAWFVATILSFIVLVIFLAEGTPTLRLRELYDRSLPYFFPSIWITILVGIVVLAGVPFLFIPAIYLGGLMSFTVYALIAEQKRGLTALAYSWHYIRGRWWTLLFRSLPTNLMIILITFLISFAFTIGSPEELLAQEIFSALFSGPITTILLWLLYTSFKVGAPEVVEDQPEIITLRKRLLILSWVGIAVWVAIVGVVIYFAGISAMTEISMI